ncbi:MAG: GNAT family N-acetyltransferase [Armatimonadetes bacterium]|nr:GNAT family N-acetyltransferase [Armatimonadota bacterium]
MQAQRVYGWLSETYWSPRIRRDVLEKAFANSLVAGAFLADSGEQVAVVRAVTDWATFAWLCDVYVVEEHRGRGLASRLISLLEDHPDLQTLRRWTLATRDAQPVYEKLGYQRAEEGRFMMKRLADSNWQEPN